MTDPNVPNTTPAPPAPQYYAPAAAARPTNTLAIISLIGAFVFPLAGIICGHIAMGQIKRTGEGGQQLALWGTILSYVFFGIGLIFMVIYFVAMAALVGGAATYGY